MPRCPLNKRRFHLTALRFGIRTSCMETTPAWDIHRTWQIAFDNLALGTSCKLRYGISLSMKNVSVCDVVFVFAYILKPAWRAVVSVAYNHFVFDHKTAHLPSFAIAVFRPYSCHAQIPQVKFELFLVLVHCLLYLR